MLGCVYDIPSKIVVWMLDSDEAVIQKLNDWAILQEVEVMDLHKFYNERADVLNGTDAPWMPYHTNRILYIGKWIDALFCTNTQQIIYDEEITKENLAVFPSEKLRAQDAPPTTPFSAMSDTPSPVPFSNHQNITNRFSSNTNMTGNTYQ